MRTTALFVLSLAAAAALHAQSQRTFVASSGLDSNPCSRTAPCRNFAAAVAAVQDGGEVVVLDSAGYGPVSIAKSVSIVAPAGVYAGISAFSGDAITIDGPTKTVALRGLTLTGLGALFGIDMLDAGGLHISSCVISGFNQPGGAALHLTPFTGISEVFLDGVEARENDTGFYVSSAVDGVVSHCRAERNNVDGFEFVSASTTSYVSVRDSYAVLNGRYGFLSEGAFVVNVRDCVSAQNVAGVGSVNGDATVCTSMLTSNDYALYNNGGTILSCGNNQAYGNSNANFGTIGSLAQQ